MYSEEQMERQVRRYLLGDLTEAEQHSLEERLMLEEDFAQTVELVEDDLVEDYADDRLRPPEKELFEQRFLTTLRRQQKLRLVRDLKKYAMRQAAEKQIEEPGANWFLSLQSLFVPWWKPALAVGLALALGLIVWQTGFRRSALEDGLMALNQAWQTQRPVEARISGLTYAPFSVTRGNNQNNADYRELDEAEVLLRRAVRERADAASLHALGKLYLSKKEFDKAIEQLEEALKTDSQNAQLHSDLGAALLEKSQREADQQISALAIGRGLDELNRAVSLDGSLLEALFNRALCRQLMGLSNQAEEGWKEYLQKDAGSPWAEEARQQLKNLEEQRKKVTQLQEKAVETFIAASEAGEETMAWQAFKAARRRNGNAIVERLVNNWLTQRQQNQLDEAERQLRWLDYAGDLERRRTGDQFTAELAAYYRQHGSQHLSALIEGHQLLQQAAAQYNQSHLATAQRSFEKAAAVFQQTGDDPEARLAESWSGYCRVRLSDSTGSLTVFDRLIPVYRARHYQSLLGYALEASADAHTGRDQISAAIDKAENALALCHSTEDWPCALRSQNALAAINQTLGKYEESLAVNLQGARLSWQQAVEARQAWSFYSGTSLSLLKLGYVRAAADSQTEAHYLAKESAWPLYQSLSYLRQGLIQANLGNSEKSVDYASLSLQEATQITDESVRADMMADALLNKGHLLRRAGKNAEAVVAYQQAIALYQQTPFRLFSCQALEGCFLAHLAMNDEAGAAAELSEITRLLEGFRGQLYRESYRNSFFDEAQEFYDAAINFEAVRQHNVVAAFHLAETSRARSLLDAQLNGAAIVRGGQSIDLQTQALTSPFSLTEVQQRLSPNTSILYYSVQDDRVISWVIDRVSFFSFEHQVTGRDLIAKTEQFIRLVSSVSEGNTDTVQSLSKELYEILLRPLESRLQKQGLLCVVPDKALHSLPFAALVSPQTGRFFIEDYSLVMAPSATAFVLGAAESVRKTVSKESLLCLGNPQFDRHREGSLPDLPSAALEAEQVSALYPRATFLSGAQADESGFRQYAPAAEVIHIAGHSIADARSPLLSRLLLSSVSATAVAEESGDGLLHAYEICQMKLPRTRLVILSACQTAVGRSYHGEGVMNMARPFLIAGVPTVLASLWKVDSELTRQLMVKFHAYRRQPGYTTAQALRAAQLEVLRERKQKQFTWAAFVVIGGEAAC